MLVSREDIEKAKEKLGDENAFLIANLLELDDFDEKNLKSQDMQDALDGNKIQKYNFTINVLGEEI